MRCSGGSIFTDCCTRSVALSYSLSKQKTLLKNVYIFVVICLYNNNFIGNARTKYCVAELNVVSAGPCTIVIPKFFFWRRLSTHRVRCYNRITVFFLIIIFCQVFHLFFFSWKICISKMPSISKYRNASGVSRQVRSATLYHACITLVLHNAPGRSASNLITIIMENRLPHTNPTNNESVIESVWRKYVSLYTFH